MPEDVSKKIGVQAGGSPVFAKGCADGLTARERQVLSEIVRGSSSKQAGRALGISPRTVETHRAHIMEKLGAENVADLVRIALVQGVETAPKH